MSQINSSSKNKTSNTSFLYASLSAFILVAAFTAGTFLFNSFSVQASETINADLNEEYFASQESQDASQEFNHKNNEADAREDRKQIAQADTQNDGESRQCDFITDNLRIDFNNDRKQVLRLQAFLKAYEYDYVDLTGSFDESTLRAVRAFQARHADDILAPWGYEADEATGYVYITTKQKINEIYCNQDLSLSANARAEIQQHRDQLSQWRQEGASFETPEYLRQYNPELAARTAPQPSGNDSGQVAGSDDTVAQADTDGQIGSGQDTGDIQDDEQMSDSTSSEDMTDATTSTSSEAGEEDPGFFDRLFGNGEDNSATSSDGQDRDNTESTTTTDGNGQATSLDRAATSVYSGVNSVVGFILSPTFLLILLGLLILMLIATLLEEEDDDNDDYSELYQTEEGPDLGDDGGGGDEESAETDDENDEQGEEETDADNNDADSVSRQEEKTKRAEFDTTDSQTDQQEDQITSSGTRSS